MRDAATGPRFAPWREQALRRGHASVLGLPLVADSTALGALTIYASEPNAFDEEEVELMLALANDLAYGVLALRTRAERARAEESLRQASAELERRVAERPRQARPPVVLEQRVSRPSAGIRAYLLAKKLGHQTGK
jgi:GAF domain-containing protein